MKKRFVGVYIEEKLLKTFKEYIFQAYSGNVHGALSAEFQNALAEYLKIRHTQIHTKPINPGIPLVHQFCGEIIQNLKACGFINQASRQVITKTISEVRGSDRRTVRKWLKILVRHGYLKNIGTYTYEIL